ncbi:MAG: hypothetical protein K2J24_06865 [Muribaculaceae bacterium]|nr:hypothetical protein [Muribaculaceae bacterium]
MAESLHTVLSGRYSPAQSLASRENLSIKETKTTYKLSFGIRRQSVVYQIDGNIITEGNKCDYLILAKQDTAGNDDEKWKSIFVELKGKDVLHALKQLDATLDNKLFKHSSVNEVHARIVARAFPANKADTEFEKARRRFKTKHKNCTFKQITSNQADYIP